jgi:hypothetical protein
VRHVLGGSFRPVGLEVFGGFGVARRSRAPTDAAQELTVVSRPSEVMRDVYAGEPTIGKLVDGELIAFPGGGCYPCLLTFSAAPTMPPLGEKPSSPSRVLRKGLQIGYSMIASFRYRACRHLFEHVLPSLRCGVNVTPH